MRKYEAVFQVVDAEHLVDGLVEDLREGGQLGGEKLSGRGAFGLGDEGVHPVWSQIGEGGGHNRAVGEIGLLREGPLGSAQALCHPVVTEEEKRTVELRKSGGDGRAPGHGLALGSRSAPRCGLRPPRAAAALCLAPGRGLDEAAQERIPFQGRERLLRDEPGEALSDVQQGFVVLAGMRPGQSGRAPGQELPEEQRGLLRGEGGVQQVEDQLREQGEALQAVFGPLEVGPVPQKDRLEAVDQEVHVAVTVKVFCQGVGQGHPHSVVALHSLQEGLVAVGNHDRLGRPGKVGPKGVGVDQCLDRVHQSSGSLSPLGARARARCDLPPPTHLPPQLQRPLPHRGG